MTAPSSPTRRTALSIGGAGLAATALAACTPAGVSPGGSSGGSDDTPPPGASAEVATLSEIPVGGSISATLDGAPIVLAQLEAGSVVGYSAICTHQGCVIAPQGAEFDCPCHQSRFDAATGEPFPGSQAIRPLAKLTVTVSGDTVTASA